MFGPLKSQREVTCNCTIGIEPTQRARPPPRPDPPTQIAAPAMVGSDAANMVAVGLVWGATNAFMRRGALVWDRRLRSFPSSGGTVRRWADLLLTWQYSLPFLANLSASAAFFSLLGDAPISVAVPATNATTFAATAVTAALLGEETRPAPAAVGTALIVLGVWVCIS